MRARKYKDLDHLYDEDYRRIAQLRATRERWEYHAIHSHHYYRGEMDLLPKLVKGKMVYHGTFKPKRRLGRFWQVKDDVSVRVERTYVQHKKAN